MTRNYENGAVTRLSPYISRGVLSTRDVFEHVRSLRLDWHRAEKFIQELAWRDYWQHVWIAKGDQILIDLKRKQEPISNYGIPRAVIKANTGIKAIDHAIKSLYSTGYMHNHMRMYIASICCNIAHCHWKEPAKWLYAHLLDGDLASNHLNWQWVAGSNSNKKYYMNQDNINKYFSGQQKDTFLDLEYDAFADLPIPYELKDLVSFEQKSVLPKGIELDSIQNRPTLIYNYYNLDPNWHRSEDVQRIFLLEPSHFKEHPVSENCIDFAIELSGNINGIKLFTGEFHELMKVISPKNLIYKEHPLNRHYKGQEDARDWLTDVTGYFPSFFAFWKRCKKQLQW